jgi:serine/threonine protein kinase
VLALGPKRSELPYSPQDRTLLALVADAAAIGLENRRLRDSGSTRSAAADESPASECLACGVVVSGGAERCASCGAALRTAALPAELFGKFRLERRIGEGAMGVVYGALDLALARRVALKTLPRTSPEDAARLRRESRAMAAVTHPNLALILGAETWQGTPVLVLEYLPGGTLEGRLADGPLPPAQALDVAARMARVLERVHKAGLLHRDVKPSNVGFAEDGEPKLLDFGLVQILSDVVTGASTELLGGPLEETGLAGTPLYMSPEALEGRRPDPGFDLWSLAVVAFEAAAGRHPFERGSPSATFAAIRGGFRDELRELLPERMRAVAGDLFDAALASERGRRPVTAAELGEGLRKAADALAVA